MTISAAALVTVDAFCIKQFCEILITVTQGLLARCCPRTPVRVSHFTFYPHILTKGYTSNYGSDLVDHIGRKPFCTGSSGRLVTFLHCMFHLPSTAVLQIFFTLGYWLHFHFQTLPSPPLDNVRVMVLSGGLEGILSEQLRAGLCDIMFTVNSTLM